jgi:thiol-disulfide isomerase/thioredoxin
MINLKDRFTIIGSLFFIILIFAYLNTSKAEKSLEDHVDLKLFVDETQHSPKTQLPVILHIYDNFCMFCKRDQGLLEMLEKRNDLRIYGINVSERFEHFQEFVKKHPKLYDLNLFPQNTRAVTQLGIKALPVTIILNANSQVIYYHKGSFSKRQLEDDIITKYMQAVGE